MFGMMISSSEVDEDIQFASVKSGKAWIRQVTLQEEKEKRFRFFSLFVLTFKII